MEKPKELIIPLIHKNRWYREDAERGDKSSKEESTDPPQEDTVESQAVKELIEGVLRRAPNLLQSTTLQFELQQLLKKLLY